MDPTSVNLVNTVSTAGEGSVIWIYVIIIAAIAFLPHLIDVILTYSAKMRLRKILLDTSIKEKFSAIEYKKIVEEANTPPKGIAGLSRGTMAILAIVIMGIALFHLLVTRQTGDTNTINTIIAMLGSLIAAIVGFYFGGKTVGEATEAAKKKDGEADEEDDTRGARKPKPSK
jgi:hypothetical protein